MGEWEKRGILNKKIPSCLGDRPGIKNKCLFGVI